MVIYNKFWIPLYKYQLLSWFKKHKPEWKQWDLKKKPKRVLMAIYMKIRKGEKQ